MKCKYCGQDEFNSTKELMGHRNRKSNIKCLELWKEEQAQIKASKAHVKCEICGDMLRNISNTHLRKHGITQSEYKHKYPNAKIFSDGLLDVQKERREKKIIERYGGQHVKSNSLSSYQRKYGEEEGLIRYKKRCESAGNSLDNFIKKFGEIEGTELYKDYRDKQKGRGTKDWYINKCGIDVGCELHKKGCDNKSNGHKIDYYYHKHGVAEGEKIWKEINNKKRLVIENFIIKYGEEEGEKRYKEHYSKRIDFYQSKMALELFEQLSTHLLNERFFYYGNPKEYGVYLPKIKKYTFLDFYAKDRNKVIEFYGNYWHANPELYPNGTIITYPNKNEELAEVIQERDRIRNEAVEARLSTSVLVVWELEYNLDKKGIIDKCLQFLCVK